MFAIKNDFFLQFLVKTPVGQTFNLELNIPDGVTFSEAAGDRLSVVVGSLAFPWGEVLGPSATDSTE